MAVTSKMYGYHPYDLSFKLVNMNTDSIKVALFTSGLTIAQATNHYFDAAPYDANQVPNGNGYTTGGQAVAGQAVTYDSGTRTTKFTHNAVVWGSSTITARHAIHYDDTPVSNKPLVCYSSSDVDIISTNGNWTYTPNASGVTTIIPA